MMIYKENDMGVYIPNMEKPKNCYACSFNDGIFCALIDNDTDAFIKENPTEKVLPDCPLIEIVRCGECKYQYMCGHQINRHGLTLKLTCCEYGEGESEDFNPYQGDRDRDENGEIY